MKKLFYVLFLVLLVVFVADAQVNTEKTEILILGTPHLSQIKGFQPSMLTSVIQKLDSMKFDGVCVERMPGQLLYDIKSRNDSAFSGVTEGVWGRDRFALANTVQKVLGISFLDAEQNIRDIFTQEDINNADRKKLIYNYLARTDIVSAALQYQYVKNDKELFSSAFDKYLVEELEKRVNAKNEIYSLAVNLAHNRKLNTIEDIDNFQDEMLLMKYFPEFIQDYKDNIQELSAISQKPIYQKLDEIIDSALAYSDMSDVYHFVNSPEYMTEDVEAQWDVWLHTNFPSGSDRARYSLWEMRNLQIAANILNVTAHNPAKRIVVIIGSSHKSFLEKYLKQMPDVELLNYD